MLKGSVCLLILLFLGLADETEAFRKLPPAGLLHLPAIRLSDKPIELDLLREFEENSPLFTAHRDIDVEALPAVLRPYATTLVEIAGNWALEYADLSPQSPQTLGGILFLLTNLGFTVAGSSLASQGDFFNGAIIELAGIVSIWYHYRQLQHPKSSATVQLALLVDYITALCAMCMGLLYVFDMGISEIPVAVFISGPAAFLFLVLGWFWEFGTPYIINHSLWSGFLSSFCLFFYKCINFAYPFVS